MDKFCYTCVYKDICSLYNIIRNIILNHIQQEILNDNILNNYPKIMAENCMLYTDISNKDNEKLEKNKINQFCEIAMKNININLDMKNDLNFDFWNEVIRKALEGWMILKSN